jgi:hypothetical protein
MRRFLLKVIFVCSMCVLPVGCTQDQVVQGIIAITTPPCVVPIGVAFDTSNAQSFGFEAKIVNQGWQDATRPFNVRIVVNATGLPGSPSSSLLDQNVPVDAGSNPVIGIHSVAPIAVRTRITNPVGSYPYRTSATYLVNITADPDQLVNQVCNSTSFTWVGHGP